MKKQNTLDYLVKHLKQWPTDKKYAPVVDGYRWVKYAGEDLFLFDNIGTEGDLKITKNDWFLAQLTKESTVQVTNFDMNIKFEGKEYITGVRGNVTPKQKEDPHIKYENNEETIRNLMSPFPELTIEIDSDFPIGDYQPIGKVTTKTCSVATKQKIYIAGGMTGYKNFNRKAFNDTALKLLMEYIVLNPAILPDGLSQKDYMSICLPMVACCDVIYMLDGYEESGGALSELALAEKLGLTVILENK